MGNAIAKSGVPREEIFLTTKVWVEHYGYEQAKKSVLKSMEKLQTSYLDLILLHQPFADYYGAYRALEELYKEGKVRAIGVSNFYPDRLVDHCFLCGNRPMVNQVETHPYNQQKLAKEYMDKYQVQIEAWAPLWRGAGEDCLRILFFPQSEKIRQDHGTGRAALAFAAGRGSYSKVHA